MTLDEAFKAFELAIGLAKEVPEVVDLLGAVIHNFETGQDESPALKHAQAVIAAKFLNIPEGSV